MATVTMQPRGLGRGLSALISENVPPKATIDTAHQDNQPLMHEITLESISPGKYQPRTRFKSEPLQELSDSIAQNGVMQPILVRAITGSEGKYEIIAGERRWRAAKIAGFLKIPAIIRQLDDKQALELALVENIQRQDLSPLEEALGYQRLMEEFSYTQEALAKVVGKSRSHVANLIRLLALPEKVKQLLDEGALSMGHARALLSAQDPLALAESIISQQLSVRQTEALLRDEQTSPNQARPRAPSVSNYAGKSKDADITALEETLSQNLQLPVTIEDKAGEGRLVIHYGSLSELDKVLKKLNGGF